MTAGLFAPLDDGELCEVHRIAVSAAVRLYRTCRAPGHIAAARDMNDLTADALAEIRARRDARKQASHD